MSNQKDENCDPALDKALKAAQNFRKSLGADDSAHEFVVRFRDMYLEPHDYRRRSLNVNKGFAVTGLCMWLKSWLEREAINLKEIEYVGYELGYSRLFHSNPTEDSIIASSAISTFLGIDKPDSRSILIASAFLLGYWKGLEKHLRIPDKSDIIALCKLALKCGLEIFQTRKEILIQELLTHEDIPLEEKTFRLAINQAKTCVAEEWIRTASRTASL